MSEKLITQNLMMVEHAPNDPRSASAMLQGGGDSRELVWLAFEKANPEITDQELLMAQFSHGARYGRIAVKHISQRTSKLVMSLVVLAIIIF